MKTQTVLLAGATGMLGSRIAAHLLDLADTRVRLLVRSNGDEKLQSLLDRGAEVIEGNLADPASLDRATQGIDVIVSAIQGGRDILVDGQAALAKAGKRNGAWRIMPSDFALDLFKATPGEHAAFDARRDADEQIAKVGLEQVNVLQGSFMDMFLPGHGAVDLDAGTISFFGDGNAKVEVTSVEDTARLIARVALDRHVQPGKFAVAGDHLSFREAGEIIARVTGQPIRPVSMGSESDLRAMMAKAPAEKKVMLAYLLYMTTGQTALSNLQNGRYPDLAFEGFESFAARTVKIPA